MALLVLLQMSPEFTETNIIALSLAHFNTTASGLISNKTRVAIFPPAAMPLLVCSAMTAPEGTAPPMDKISNGPSTCTLCGGSGNKLESNGTFLTDKMSSLVWTRAQLLQTQGCYEWPPHPN